VLEHYEKRGEELRQQARELGVPQYDPLREFERTFLLQVVDRMWMDHIDALDVMRAGIGLRSLGQRDPLVEFKNESYRMFDELKVAIQHHTVDALLKLIRNDVRLAIDRPAPVRKIPANVRTNADAIAEASGQSKSENGEEARARANGQRKSGQTRAKSASGRSTKSQSNGNSNVNGSASASAKVGRNDPCPCGSGKKFKKCHGA
jgi:preprotein translocase subunit SecA